MKTIPCFAGPRRAGRGFTLFELLVVLVLIGLVSTLVVPRLAATLPGVQLRTAARKVAASLRYGRSRAVAQDSMYSANFDLTAGRLTVAPQLAPSREGSPSILPDSSQQDPGVVYDLPPAVTFSRMPTEKEGSPEGPFRILFFPAGNSSGGMILLSNEKGSHLGIQVDSITGIVRIEENPLD